jgi:hypothetical protein
LIDRLNALPPPPFQQFLCTKKSIYWRIRIKVLNIYNGENMYRYSLYLQSTHLRHIVLSSDLWVMVNCNDFAYMFNVYKNQLSRQTGSRNLTGPKTLTTIWHTYMKLETKYQISAINSCWEKCAEKYLGRTARRTDGEKLHLCTCCLFSIGCFILAVWKHYKTTNRK